RSLDVQGRPRARTDTSGAFVFAGAPTGFVRLAAWREGFRIAFSAPLEVRAGETSGEVELVLEPRDRTGSLAGLVLDAAGAPAASGIVEYRYHARGSSGSGGVVAADDGRFEIEGPQRATFDLVASDAEGELGLAFALGVEGGAAPLVLTLAPARDI